MRKELNIRVQVSGLDAFLHGPAMPRPVTEAEQKPAIREEEIQT